MKTKRVRIAVAVAPDGDWSSCGWDGAEDDDKKGIAIENVDRHYVQVVWVEADIPIPDEQTIKGQVARDEG